MGVCWYCHWGWSKPVADIYDEALRRLDGCEYPLHSGPSHIVWEDENFDAECVRYCLGLCEKPVGELWDVPDATKSETDEMRRDLEVVRWSLEQLLALPDSVRDPCPQAFWDSDEDEPEKYPPSADVEMVKRP